MTRPAKYHVRLPGRREVAVPAEDVGPTAQALLHVNGAGDVFVVALAARVDVIGPGFATTQAVRMK